MEATLRAYLFRVSVVLVSCTLIGAFGVHSVETGHDHPGHSHAGHESGTAFFSLGEYTHTTEKKALIAVVNFFVLALALGAGISGRPRALLIPRLLLSIRAQSKKVGYYSMYRPCFSDGILHPKLH